LKLSTRGRYGVRAMLELAIGYPKKPQALKNMAHSQSLSIKYLEQLLMPLKGAGLVKSVRGSKGGYLLALPPDQISLHDIVKVLEGPVAFVDCVDPDFCCDRREGCAVQQVWAGMSKLAADFLKGVTLADLIQKAEPE
jgi:Rrf2 family protein